MENKEIKYISNDEEAKVNSADKKLKFIACRECGATNTTLIKATDSYYCKSCFTKLGKQKFEKKRRRNN